MAESALTRRRTRDQFGASRTCASFSHYDAEARCEKGVTPAHIETAVKAAVESASGDDLTAADIEALVAKAVENAVSGGPTPLTKAEVGAIVASAVAAIPAPEPVVVEVETQIGTVDVLGVWGGDELVSFRAVVAPWEEATGGKVNFEGTRDLTAIVTTRVEGGNPPDIAILPNPGFMQQLARAGDLQRIDAFLNMSTVRDEYSKAWIDLGSVDGALYAIYFKASPKGTVWYNPATFAANGWEVPTTWDEMLALSDQMVAAGMSPWSVAAECGGAADGWPISDWLQQTILGGAGPDIYDGLVNGTVAWTDPAVKSAWENFGKIIHTEGYVPGGSTAVLTANFITGSYLPFNETPQAQMYFLGSFAKGFIADQFPALTAGDDYSFFDFPTIDPQYAGAVTGGADVVVAFNDEPGTKSLMRYLSSAGAQQIWVSRGGFTAVNNKVSLTAYPDDIDRLVAQQLTAAEIFRFDLDDLLGGDVQKAIWKGLLDYAEDASNLDSVLADIDAVASGT